MRKRVQRADQHRDRKQLVHMTWHGQQNVEQHVLQPVIALAQVTQFVDQIEEREQREKGNENEQRRSIDLARKVAPDREHHRLPAPEPTRRRRQNRNRSSNSMAACTIHQPVPNPSLPEDTQA